MQAPSPSDFAARVRFARRMEDGLGFRHFKRLARGTMRSGMIEKAVRWNDQLAPAERLSVGTVAELIDWLANESALKPLDVPAWMTIDTLGGHCPVQGEGLVDGHSWYFRSRHEWMSVVVGKPGTEPIDEADEGAIFWLELPFPNKGDHGAGWLDPNDVVGFIVRALGAFREERAAGWVEPGLQP